MDIWIPVILALISTLGAYFTQTRQTRKQQRNESAKVLQAQKEQWEEVNSKMDAQNQMIIDMDARVINIETRAQTRDSEEAYKKMLSDAINIVAFNTISSNKDLKDSIKTVLNLTQKKIASFAIFHRKNPYRHDEKGKGKWAESLILSADTIKDEMRHAVLDLFTTKKKKVIYEGLCFEVDYDQYFYKTTQAERLITELINALIANGMTDDDYITLFETFMGELIQEQIKANRQWNLIPWE